MKRAVLYLLLTIASRLVVAQELRTDISVHDPVMIKQDSVYYLFCTGQGISLWSSVDMVHWKAEKQVFESAPAWTQNGRKAYPGPKRDAPRRTVPAPLAATP